MVGHWLLQPFGAEVIEARFEDWDGPPGRFALVYAATAWHWVDPAVRYQKAAKMLEDVYDEIGEGLPPDYVLPRPQDLPNERAEIERGGLFDVVDVRQYDWEVEYDDDSYIDLLSTFSGHIAMQDWQRDRLYGEIRRRLAERPSSRLRRDWGGVLDVARRRDA